MYWYITPSPTRNLFSRILVLICLHVTAIISISLSTYNISLIFTFLGYNSSFLISQNLANWNNTSPNLGISLKYRDVPFLHLVLPTWNPCLTKTKKKHITLTSIPKRIPGSGSPSDHSKVSGSMVARPGSADRLGVGWATEGHHYPLGCPPRKLGSMVRISGLVTLIYPSYK